jgi:hypothetical protein
MDWSPVGFRSMGDFLDFGFWILDVFGAIGVWDGDGLMRCFA